MDLIAILSQEGHSGMLEGTCRIHFEGDYLNAEDYFKRNTNSVYTEVTFAYGTKGLGRYNVEFFGFNDTIDGNIRSLDSKRMFNKHYCGRWRLL